MKKPSLFRRSVMGLVSGWRRVMDVRYNPLKYIPDPSLQTYFMLLYNSEVDRNDYERVYTARVRKYVIKKTNYHDLWKLFRET